MRLSLDVQDTAPPTPQATRSAGRSVWLWFLLLPLFFQIYHYKLETGPLYALSKAWPILLVPLIVLALTRLRMADGPLYIAFCAYALIVPPTLSMIYLPNGLLDGLLSSIKAWPMTYYFSLAALILLLCPSEAVVRRAVLLFGAGTFAALLLLWLIVPAEWYQPVAAGANMFSWDAGRGSYIRMPMMLGVLWMLWLAHRLAREWRAWQALAVLGCLSVMATLYKARLPTGVCVLLIGLILFAHLPPRVRWMLGALALLPAAAMTVVLGPSVPERLGEIFDASLFIRLHSVTIAWDWITSDPVKLIFGSGSASTYSSVSMAEFFGYPDFWLTDIGWLGVLMEYGLIGTAMIAAIHLRAYIAARALGGRDAFRAALADYVLFEILCSAVYSVMYAPGPVVVVAVLAWWLGLRDDAGMSADEFGWPWSRAMPRA